MRRVRHVEFQFHRTYVTRLVVLHAVNGAIKVLHKVSSEREFQWYHCQSFTHCGNYPNVRECRGG